MTVSELIAELQALLEEHGDLPVYSIVDHDYVTGAGYDEVSGWRGQGSAAIVIE